MVKKNETKKYKEEEDFVCDGSYIVEGQRYKTLEEAKEAIRKLMAQEYINRKVKEK